MSIEVVIDAWWLAECQDCEPVLVQPFRDEADRDEWTTIHSATTGHVVLRTAVAA